jgi:hypothetical protein
VLDEDGYFKGGSPYVDYETGELLDNGDYASAYGPTAVSPSGTDYGSGNYIYDAVGDPEFLNPDDAWLAVLRQVLFVS